jgi:hypothetical protein
MHSYIKYFVAFLILVNIGILLMSPKARGYEASIYESISIIFWFTLSISIAFGIIVIILEVIMGNGNKKNKWWLIGAWLICFNYMLVLLLPTIRGYLLQDRTDSLYHIGYTVDILRSTHILDEDIYPAFHILLAFLSNILDAKPIHIAKFIPLLSYLTYVLGLFSLSKVTGNKGESLLILAFGLPLLFPYYSYISTPFSVSSMLIPLIIYILLSARARALLMFFSLSIPFWHPDTSLALIILLTIFVIVHQIIKSKYSIYLIIITFIVSYMHYSQFIVFNEKVLTASKWLCGVLKETILAHYQEAAETAGLSIYELIRLLIRQYFQYIIYLMLSIILITSLLWDMSVRSIQKISEVECFSLACFFCFSILTIVFLSGPEGLFNCWRLAIFTIIVASFINGLILNNKLNKLLKSSLSKRILLSLILVLVIVTSSLSSIRGFYNSPYAKSLNYQVTNHEWNCAIFLLEKKNGNITWYWITGLMRGLPYAILGINETSQTLRIARVPSHFRYKPIPLYYSCYWEVGNISSGYILITKYDLELYRFYDIWRIQGSFTPEDFDKLYQDLSVNFIYGNDECIIIWKS